MRGWDRNLQSFARRREWKNPGLSRLLANRRRETKLARCRLLLQAPEPPVADKPPEYRDRYQRLTGVSLRNYPQCPRDQMVCIESFLAHAQPRGPPRIAS